MSTEQPEAPALPGVTRHRKSERRQRSVLVSVRLLPHELEIVQALACAAGMEYSVSGYLRKTALDQAATYEPAGEEKAPAVPPPPVAASFDRESLGRIVHEQRLACEAERAALEGRERFRLGPWERRTYEQQETDMRTGEAVAAAERARIAARMDELAANYPVDVFPPDSDVRDGISGTAMRHAYSNAAREIREADRG